MELIGIRANNWLFQINIMSKFQTYKQQKKDVPSITKSNSKTDSSKSPVKAHIEPSTTTAQKPGTVSNGVVEKPPSLFVGTKQTIAVNAKQQQTSKPVGKCKKLDRPPDKRNGKLFLLFPNQNICCGKSKELSMRWYF